jgi:hypothetical protein
VLVVAIAEFVIFEGIIGVDYWYSHGTRREALVLRESFFMDQEDTCAGTHAASYCVFF